MIDSNDIKKYLKQLGHSTVRVRTIPGRGQWIHAWIPSDRGNPLALKYSVPAFSTELRKAAVEAVYGPGIVLSDRGNYGNIGGYSISMQSHQWDRLIAAQQLPAI